MCSSDGQGYGACACGLASRDAGVDGGTSDAPVIPVDASQMWSPVAGGFTGVSEDVAFGSDPTAPIPLYVATRGDGIQKSIDTGNTWRSVNVGITNRDARTVTTSPMNATAIFMTSDRAGGTPHVFRTGDAGGTWTAVDITVPTGRDYDVRAFRSQPNLGPVAVGFDPSTSRAVVLVGAAGGTLWNPFPCGGTTGTARAIVGSGPNDLHVAVYGGAAATGGVFHAVDGAKTWTATSDGIDADSLRFVQTLEIDPTNPKVLFAGVEGHGQLFKSENGGAAWIRAASGLPSTISVQKVVVRRSNPIYVLAGTSSGVYRSYDAGVTWTLWGLEGLSVRTLAIDPSVPGAAAASVFAGVDATPSLHRASTGN